MAAALAGLTDLYGQLDRQPAGTVDEGAYQLLDQQVPSDAHSLPGDTSGQTWPGGYGLGYSGQSVYTDSSGVLTDYVPVPYTVHGPPGEVDETPSSHAGLWPRPEATEISTLTPDTLWVVGEQSRLLHGLDYGGPAVFSSDSPGGHEEPVNLTTDRYEAPNENHLLKAVGHLRSLIGGIGGNAGGGHLGAADVDQGYGELNTLPEFQAGHSIRYVQHDTLHFDHTGLKTPEEGVWLGRHPSGTQQSFDGPDSPYSVQGQTTTGVFRPEVRGFPTEFAATPAPTVLPALAAGPDVFAWGG